MGNPVDGVKKWLLGVALKKVVTRAVPWVVSLVGTYLVKANSAAGPVGVTISVDEATLAAGIAAGLATLQNWIKTKYNVTWL